MAALMPMKLVSKPLGASILLLTTAAGLAFGACGYPTFSFDSGTTSTGGGAGGMGGGTPGVGGEASSSSGVDCMLTGLNTCTPTCGCLADQKCTVTDETAGTMTCITAGPVDDWAKCNANQDCGAKSFCDHTRKVCKPICDGAGQCPANAQCIPAKTSDGKADINGLKVCTAHCEPTSAAPCGPSITCFYDTKNVDFDCSFGSNLVEGVTCVGSNSCAKGLVCAGDSTLSTCAQWCTPINEMGTNDACPAARPTCYSLTANVEYDGVSYGICDSP